MKTIKHLLLVATACLTTSLYAQKISVGISAGASMANFKIKVDHAEPSDSKIGATAGLMVNVPIGEHVSIQPALNFVQKGAKASDKYSKDAITLNYLELPVNLIYTTGKGKGFFAGGGPAVSAGISGTFKSTDLSTNKTDKTKVKFGNNAADDDYKTMEFSANILAGYKFSKNFQVALNYDFGFSNLFIDSKDGTLKNKYWGIRVGYLFH